VGATDEPVAQAAAEAAPHPAADAAANTEKPRANTLDQAELDALTAQLAQVTADKKAGVTASTTGSAQSAPAADAGSAAGLTAKAAAASPAGEAGNEPAVLGAAQVAASAADATEFQPPELSGDKPTPQTTAIEMLDDVELDVKIELGRTSMYIEDVLRLGVGAVVELDKLAGDPVDIYVNERLVARGEVLVLNDNFCVRINQIHSPIPELENG
jgi:flagellar motor switch protein FliN/FliY